jgi:hypothetical protein
VRDLLVNLVAGLLLAGLGAAATKGYEIWKRHRENGHLYSLVPRKGRVQIVVPGFDVKDFMPLGSTERAIVPPNLRAMPMSEGGAIAQVITMLNSLGRLDTQLVAPEAFQDNCPLTISFGGPSVNPVSGDILRTYFPSFAIKYPEHIASYGSMTYQPARAADGSLVEDYGFIASVTAETGRRRYLVLCGVWSMGTQIAADALLDLPRGSEVRGDLRDGTAFLAVAHGSVHGLSHGNVRIQTVRHG